MKFLFVMKGIPFSKYDCLNLILYMYPYTFVNNSFYIIQK